MTPIELIRVANAVHAGRLEQALFYGHHQMPDARLITYGEIKTVEGVEFEPTTVKKGS